MYSFESGETLAGIAFLDVNVYVTSLRSLKSYLMIGDINRSIWFVGYQEDPSKLVLLGKDYHPCSVIDCNYLIDDGSLGFLVADKDQNLQILSFNPTRKHCFNYRHCFIWWIKIIEKR